MQLDIKLRDYQGAIIDTAVKHNCLVVLPTGMGKTIIALFAAINRFEKFPQSKILFLAPTRPLASQHLSTFKKNLPELYAEMQLFTGKINSRNRQKLWQTSDIIFSTPQCIANDLRRGRIDLKDVSLLIEDEAHRCLKNYAYTYVAKNYLETSRMPRILGLTASPGSDKSTIDCICKNLGIEKVEIRSRYSDDVEPYIQKLDTEIIKVELPEEFKIIKSHLKKIYDRKIDELQKRKLLFSRPTKKTILELQSRIARAISSGNMHFNLLRGIGLCGQAIKISHAIELLETQSINSIYAYLKSLIKKAETKSAKSLINDIDFSSAYLAVAKLYNENFEHPKLEKLKEIFKKEKGKKTIVFSQYRDTISRIKNELDKIPISSEIFVGQQKKGSLGLSQKEQALIIERFKRGEIDCLISTSIGEEGLDLPEVNLVIFYEPVPSAIRKIQRSGRTARLKPGKIITLITKGTLDESNYWVAYHKEKKMYEILNSLKKELGSNKNNENQLNLKKFIN
jgi:Fanconi anemia group M protein